LRKPKGSAKDFLDIASRTTIDVTPAELARKGIPFIRMFLFNSGLSTCRG
jgi:hypothetical protein